MASPSEVPVSTSTQTSRLVALLVAGAFFMENLDGTVIATALPQMAQSFHSSPVDLNMGMTAYLLTLAVFIPVSGWVADRLGPRTVFSSAIAVFTFASVLCGFSNTLWQFTAARILQGLGGAMMVPVGRLVVLRVTEKKDLMLAMAYIIWPGLVAPVIGPPAGGFITTYSSWRWIFFLNVPLGLIGITLAMLWIKNERDSEVRPFDWLGFTLAGTACTSFMYSLELLGRQKEQWSEVSLFLGYSVVAGWLAVRHMSKSRHPLIDFACLREKTFAISIWGGSLFRIAINASPFLLPLMFQVPFGMTAFQSGLLILAMFAGNLTMKSVTTPVLRKFGFKSAVNCQRSSYLVVTARLRVTSSTNTEACDYRGAVPARSVSIDAVHQHQHAGVCRHPQAADQFGDQFFGGDATDVDGYGSGGGSGCFACRGVDARPLGRSAHVDGFSHRIRLSGGAGLVAILDCLTLPPLAGAEVSGHKAA